MNSLADFLIAVLVDFKTYGEATQLAYAASALAAAFAPFFFMYRRIKRLETDAIRERLSAQNKLTNAEVSIQRMEGELAEAQKFDPAHLKAAHEQAEKQGDAPERFQGLVETYLKDSAEGQALAHITMAKFHLGRKEWDEALRHARGAVAATPRDPNARGLLATVTGRIEESRKEPETEAEIAAAAEETRLAKLIAEDDVDAMTLHRVGQSEFERGWYRVAAAIWERALAKISAVDGASAPFALQIRLQIARATLWAGDHARAESLVAPLPAAMELVFTSTAAETLEARLVSAEVDLNRGRAVEAEEGFRNVHALAVLGLGREANLTLNAQFYLARALLDQGKAAEAEEALQALLPVRARVSGEEHPETLTTRSSIAHALLNQGKAAEAEAAWRALLPVRARVSGEEHPDTLTTRSSIAHALLNQGKAAEAEAAWRALLPVGARVSGEEHPHTLTTRSSIARALLDQGKAAEAEEAWRALLPVWARVLGEEHPHTLVTRYRLAQAVLQLGRVDEAAEALGEVASVAERMMAETDPKLGYIAILRAQAAEALGDRGAADGFVAEAEANWGDRILPEHPYRREMAVFLASRG